MAVDMQALGADSIALSAHKMGGPAGVGALLIAPHVPLFPLIQGGGQERGWRGGTHALPAIAGFGAVAKLPPVDLSPLRDQLEREATGAIVIGGNAARLGNTSCLALPGVTAQIQVMTLDLAGIAVSAGAACSSGKVARSHVLDAMGLGAVAGEAIRVSLPWNVSEADITAFGIAWWAMAARLSSRAA
jgi:cysteine desulfurase